FHDNPGRSSKCGANDNWDNESEALRAHTGCRSDFEPQAWTGSRDDPIVFCRPLAYHASFSRYCMQHDLDPTARRLVHSDGQFYDVVTRDDTEGLVYGGLAFAVRS